MDKVICPKANSCAKDCPHNEPHTIHSDGQCSLAGECPECMPIDANPVMSASVQRRLAAQHGKSLSDLSEGMRVLTDEDTAYITPRGVKIRVRILKNSCFNNISQISIDDNINILLKAQLVLDQQYHNQVVARLDAAVEQAKKEERERIFNELDIHDNELGFCEISNHIPYSQLERIKSGQPVKGERE